MIITGAFLAEHAEIVDRKLNITGGVWDTVTAPATGDGVPMFLVALVQAGPDDQKRAATAQVTILQPDGSILAKSPETAVTIGDGNENGALVLPLSLAPAGLGRHVFLIEVDGSAASVPVLVVAA